MDSDGEGRGTDSPTVTHAFIPSQYGISHEQLKLRKAKERLPNARELPLDFMQKEDEQRRKTAITKKLQLFRKRNLQQSLNIRQSHLGADAMTTPHNVQPLPSSASGPLGSIDYSSLSELKPPSTAPPQLGKGIRVVYKDKRKEFQPLLHSATFNNRYEHKPQTADTVGHAAYGGGKEFQQTMANVQKIWISRRAQEAEERLEEMEFRDIINMWSFNQARVEEEINRRQESFQMSSQTGKTCHKILRRPVTAPVPENIGLHVRVAADILDLRGSTPPLPHTSLHSHAVTLLSHNNPDMISLSPYDNYDAELDKPNMKLLKHKTTERTLTPDMHKESEMMQKGLHPTHPSSIRSTSLLNNTLDVMCTPATVFAPSMAAGIGKLPSTNLVSTDDPNDKKKTGSRTASPKPKPKGKEGGGKKKNVRRGPVDPNLLEQIFPTLSVEQEVPSLHRMNQMQQVEAIREAFAMHGLSVPTSAIEKGILTPEDRPYTECLSDLPPPEFGLVRDFTKKTAVKGGKGKKGKKKKGGAKT